MKNNSINAIINEVKRRHTFPDFILLTFVILLLGIDYIPYFENQEIINPQFFYLSILNVLIGVYFYSNYNLIPNNIFLVIKKSIVGKLYFSFLFFCVFSLFFAKNATLVYTKFTEIMIVFCLFVNLSILLKDKLELFNKIILIISISAFLQSWMQLHHFVIISKQFPLTLLLTTMKGNTGSINILAASLTIKIPFILLGITRFKNYKKLFLVFALFSVAAVVFLTAARAALLNLFLIFSLYFTFILKEYSFNKLTFIKVLYFLIPMVAAFIFSNSIFKKSKDKDRFVSVEHRITKITTDDASSQARLTYWGNALKMTQKSNCMGIGLGNYQVECMDYEKTIENDTVVSLHVHNDFLEIMAETGLINGIIYFSIFVFVLILNLRTVLKSIDNEKRNIAILCLMLLIVYVIDSFFNFPMYRPTMQIFFSILLALTLINTINKDTIYKESSLISLKKFFPVLILISLITSYSAYIICKASHLEYLISNEDINQNTKSSSLTGEEILRRISSYPNVFHSSESFYEYAGIYFLREKKSKEALECFAKASKINPYSGRIEFYKQVNSRQNGDMDSAYIYIKRAFYMRPRNFDIYKTAIRIAAIQKDTAEILKEHKLFIKYRNIPEAWAYAAPWLQNAGINYKTLLQFLNDAVKLNQKDTLLLAKRNNLLITNYIIKCQELEGQSKFNEVLNTYQQALKIDKNNVFVRQNIGFYYFKQGQNKKAIDNLLEALKYNGLNNGKTEFYLGICYLKENDKTNALKYFNLSKDKKFPPAQKLIEQYYQLKFADKRTLAKQKNDLLIANYIIKGQKFEEQSKLDKALESYEKALKVDPKSIYAAQNIGFYYLKIGQTKEAINYLLNALKYPGLNDGKTEYFLAICYLTENDKINACKYLNKSKDKKYSDTEGLLKICK